MSNNIQNDPYINCGILSEKPLKGTRKVIASHLADSYRNKLHASMSKYLEVDKLSDFKNRQQEGSFIDYFYRAVALSLLEKPELNATYNENLYTIYKDINLSIAVNTSKGLITPVLKNADKLSLNDFIKTRKEIISLALNWKHKLSDIQGGTFTLSNLGNYGIDFLSPIINPPQVAIMGIGRLCKLKIEWEDKEPKKTKTLLPVSLTYDHAVLDGVAVAEFLNVLQQKVNEPELLWENKQLGRFK